MPIVCDSINMCKERAEFLSGFDFGETPKFCPYCGKKWFDSAIVEIQNVHAHAQKEVEPDTQEESALQYPGMSMLRLR